jgi:hypothetical protein
MPNNPTPDPYNDPNDPRHLDLNRPVRRPIRRGGWYGWWWIWIVLIIAVTAWFVGWGWGGYGGWWGWGNGGRRAAVIVQPSGSGVAVLDASNKQAYVGQPFTIAGAQVRKMVGGDAYWIATRNSAPMLVVTPNQNQNANIPITSGDIVSVSGTVQSPPPAAQAKQQWGLNQDQVNRVERQGAYVQASSIEPVRSARGY